MPATRTAAVIPVESRDAALRGVAAVRWVDVPDREPRWDVRVAGTWWHPDAAVESSFVASVQSAARRRMVRVMRDVQCDVDGPLVTLWHPRDPVLATVMAADVAGLPVLWRSATGGARSDLSVGFTRAGSLLVGPPQVVTDAVSVGHEAARVMDLSDAVINGWVRDE